MHHIYISSNQYIVTDEKGYAAYEVFLEQIAICGACKQLYTLQNPRVSQNICLSCFNKKHEKFSYLGEMLKINPMSQYYTHQFLGEAGIISLTNKNNNDIKENVYTTLLHYGFSLPPLDYKEKHFGAFDWKLHGSPELRYVFVERTCPSYVFLAGKGGHPGTVAREFSMRLKADRQLYQTGNQAVAASRLASKKLNAFKEYTPHSDEVYAYLATYLSEKFAPALG